MPSLKQPVRCRPPRRVLSHALPSVAAAALVLGCHDGPTTGPPLPERPMRPHADVGIAAGPVVNSIADPGDGVCDATECTLREAIAAASPGEEITFAVTPGSVITLGSRVIIDRNLTITGQGLSVLIDGNLATGVLGVDAGVTATVRRVWLDGGVTTDAIGGPAVLNDGTLTLEECRIIGHADFGGLGAIVNRGVLTVRRCDVNSNLALAAIRDMTANELTIESSGIIGNFGRAIQAPAAKLVLLNSTVSFHDSDDHVIHAATAVIRNSTIVRNTVRGTTGVYGVLSIADGLTISGSILANGTSPNCSSSTPVTTQGHNIFAPSPGACVPGPQDQSVARADVFTKLLTELPAYRGALSPTHALLDPAVTGFPNPAIDQGSCAAAALTADQRGVPRPADFPLIADADDGCDVGAFELEPPPPCTRGDLLARVEALRNDGVLNKGHATGLMGKLDQVGKLLDRGKVEDARAVLADFRAQVAGLLADDVLSAAQAADLDGCAAEVDAGLAA